MPNCITWSAFEVWEVLQEQHWLSYTMEWNKWQQTETCHVWIRLDLSCNTLESSTFLLRTSTWLWDVVVKVWDLSAKSKVSWREDSLASSWFRCNWSSFSVDKLNLWTALARGVEEVGNDINIRTQYIWWGVNLQSNWSQGISRTRWGTLRSLRCVCSWLAQQTSATWLSPKSGRRRHLAQGPVRGFRTHFPACSYTSIERMKAEFGLVYAYLDTGKKHWHCVKVKLKISHFFLTSTLPFPSLPAWHFELLGRTQAMASANPVCHLSQQRPIRTHQAWYIR